MTQKNKLWQKDLKYIWHPCSQMKDYETFRPIEIVKANGSYLELANGKKIIDAISSWWCKSLGHGHPRLQQALYKQMEKFEHVILANACNSTIVELAEKLASLTQTLHKVSFASDGSCAVEMAIKMSIQARQICGENKRTKIMALANGYHGETSLALAVSDCDIFRKYYETLMPEVEFIRNIPYVNSRHDPLWNDCGEVWPAIEQQLCPHKDTLSAIIFEPIVQGAGGILLYSKDFLVRLRKWTQQNNVHLIADEIMTGFGRTGLPLACMHADIEPDFLCLSKGLTAGWLPLSVMLTSDSIYDIFYDDYSTGKAFLHSHTHSGNALAAAVAVEVFNIMQDENIYEQVRQNEAYYFQLMQDVAEQTYKIENIRGIGAVIAADLITEQPRLGYEVFQEAVKLGALLRPIGNTIYWLPPLNIARADMEKLRDITVQAIRAIAK